ncbi:MAG: M20/M25/M40 family metallo-hydrolase, partial [Thermoanaerobaculales bacterium]|nr:M20/M25/M40 family metallo-hydrolase [Thermoanaerobaculales bacterium]
VRHLSDGDMPALELPAREPLAALPPAYDAQSLKRTVAELADPALEGRGLGSDGLQRATALVEARLRAAGLEPAADDGIRQSWRWTGGEPAREMELVNLVAQIPGRDPKLTNQPVLVIAHLDHLGHGWPDVREGNENQVHPGADDNASGVAALLEIARVFGTMEHRPRRTLVFAFWTGEEEGKFGSGYWVRHPMWPLASTVTYINIDMIGHPWLIEEIRELVSGVPSDAAEAFLDGLDPANLVEVGLPPGNELLAGTLRTVALGTGFPLHLDRTDGRNGGSDYRDFARAGLPFLRFFGNFFPGYHEPDDTPDRVDPAQVQRVARFCLATALLLADQGSSTSAYQPRETMVVP